MNSNKILARLNNDGYKKELTILYGISEYEKQKRRYKFLLEKISANQPDKPVCVISSPGRTELGGNHTDHNLGKVLAGAVNVDIAAVAVKNPGTTVTLHSEGFPEPFIADLSDLNPTSEEAGSTGSLIRGVAARLKKEGFATGGFTAYAASSIPFGAGLSSSAAVEILIGSLFSELFNEGKIPLLIRALAGQFAEHHYFIKPCGLMDQVSCAYGKILSIDFRDPAEPLIKQVDYDFESEGYTLAVVETGSDHADLAEYYASIQQEMKSLAGAFDKSVCREIEMRTIIKSLPSLRENVSDRAILRGIHFLEENRRVNNQIIALTENRIGDYLKLVNESGNSSWKFLQNCVVPDIPGTQPIPLALALTGYFLDGDGACRIHGSGFAGAIQVYIPTGRLKEYEEFISGIFGRGSLIPLKIRHGGVVRLFAANA